MLSAGTLGLAAVVLPFTPLRLQTISHKRFLLLMGWLLKLRLLCGKLDAKWAPVFLRRS